MKRFNMESLHTTKRGAAWLVVCLAAAIAFMALGAPALGAGAFLLGLGLLAYDLRVGDDT